ncbi:hypothetical protein [Streptomyces acidiscabies]|uniref:Uncharacterized protein n=1 Tax=Streptomyces acidiscabies TaxID=42234 RepID=A0AAP6ELH0_9ACTN|nr:hypothetical protein [Streptomyces acidiscabies]MBZ3909392.1 hypothetical protein [Streptomyces acidiscabies]MDX2966621.1 hypothetical protein [Streptomyces acidiscabies]MDX3796591.1 hypothetical protein [Streptomyces acidiscabies]
MNYPVEQQFAAPAAPAPTFIGQGTAVEQSRAVAEVQAAVIVARQFPRNEAIAVQKMRTGFEQHSLAVRSFFRFRRGSSNVSGETIQFAKELARCWTNIHYGVHELRRDDAAGESEMQAWAWDLETNERASTTFIVPHTRWTKDSGGTRLEDPRDVYENNSNNGARRLREMIFSVLPDWFREQAKAIATNTVENGQGSKPLAQRAADCIAHFEGLGVTVEQLEENRSGRPSGKWTNLDLGQLSIISESIRRGEITVEEEFPQPRVTAGEIRQQHEQQNGQPTAAETPSAEDGQSWPSTRQPGTGARS